MVPILFQQVWLRLYNPRSGCPDVELGHVLQVLADVLAGCGTLPDAGSPAANWAVAFVTITGGSSPLDLKVSWSDTVPYYTDERDGNGYPVAKPFDQYDAEMAEKTREMTAALQALVDRGLLQVGEDGLLRAVVRTSEAAPV